MSRPSWVESPVFESPDEHSTSGVRLADELVPPPMVGDDLSPPPADRTATLPPAPAPAPDEVLASAAVPAAEALASDEAPAVDEAPVSGVVRVAAAAPADPYDRHLDEVVRAFFPGWGARSTRASRPSAVPARKHG